MVDFKEAEKHLSKSKIIKRRRKQLKQQEYVPNLQNSPVLYVHWTHFEKTKYVEFLIENKHLFDLSLKDKKIMGVHRRLSKYVRTRDSTQCRCHHQKMLKKYSSIDQIVQRYHYLLSDEFLSKIEISSGERVKLEERQISISSDNQLLKLENMNESPDDLLKDQQIRGSGEMKTVNTSNEKKEEKEDQLYYNKLSKIEEQSVVDELKFEVKEEAPSSKIELTGESLLHMLFLDFMLFASTYSEIPFEKAKEYQ